MLTDLQSLQDEAERRCLLAAGLNDKDAAEAWERAATAIEECLAKVKNDLLAIRHPSLSGHAAERCRKIFRLPPLPPTFDPAKSQPKPPNGMDGASK